jgi:hypothetical protein
MIVCVVDYEMMTSKRKEFMMKRYDIYGTISSSCLIEKREKTLFIHFVFSADLAEISLCIYVDVVQCSMMLDGKKKFIEAFYDLL